MDHPLIDLITAKIKAAEDAGEFDNLPGAGKPLPTEDDPQNAYLNRVMRENDAVPEFVRLSKQLEALRSQLSEMSDRTMRSQLMSEIAELEPRLALAKEAWRR